MIGKTNLEKNLKQLKLLFSMSTTQRKELFYSKLAVIELCGWIEEAMDDIILKCCNRQLKENKNREYVQEIIKNNYGFEYKKHFRKMLITVVGLINVEKMEKLIDPVKLAQLKSILGSLKSVRDRAAHTHIKGATTNINSPSITERDHNFVYNALKEIDLILRTW